DRRLLGFRGFREGHELPKGQESDPRGYEATERRHPAIDGGHQPVQQQTETQPTPADPPQEEPKHRDTAEHSGPRPSLAIVALWCASRGRAAGEYTLWERPVQGHARHRRHVTVRRCEPGPLLVITDSVDLARHRSSSHKPVNSPANYRRSACR